MKINKNRLNALIRNFLFESTGIRIKSAKTVRDQLASAGLIRKGRKLLVVDGPNQRYSLYDGKKIIKTGKVSTGAKGFGNVNNSGKTSTGLLQVTDIAGKGLKKYTVLIALKPQKPTTILGPNKDGKRKNHKAEVLTRAIVLSGLEPENKNARSRSIYVHGTNREARLGVPASGGCVRVSNDDVIDLADNLMSVGDYVYVYHPKFSRITPTRT